MILKRDKQCDKKIGYYDDIIGTFSQIDNKKANKIISKLSNNITDRNISSEFLMPETLVAQEFEQISSVYETFPNGFKNYDNNPLGNLLMYGNPNSG